MTLKTQMMKKIYCLREIYSSLLMLSKYTLFYLKKTRNIIFF
ncbi:hypothetical protein B739_0411 [Riemerella anatipestifer RA-CH-1]|uniref:Uncharacterized protein n=1 Tax=Riemerella anatipestifer RA-CH-1 TaxID=1228997 RepID=J9QXM0_RIEAN|nr:hypothetical protein B739_0411 [Riemerella anatipestifer RA-CH-1]AIH02027.1 hypothetical protein M949_0858 [Riemerella anatipestifer CH3]